MEEFKDLRIWKTKKALVETLFSMLSDMTKSSSNIKVTQICKKAKITEMTFYHHFNNRNQLIQYAVQSQLDLKLPIPKMLKPKNIKQLVIYLMNILSNLFNDNAKLMCNSFEFIEVRGLKDSYLSCLFKTLCMLINQELLLIYPDQDRQILNVWSDCIVSSTFKICLSCVISNRRIDYRMIIDGIKLLAVSFNVICQ